MADALCDEVDVCALGFRTFEDNMSSPLAVAAIQQHVDVVAMLISAGADVNAVATCNRVGGMTLTPIFGALMSASIEIVRLLISAGADVNAVMT